MPLKIALRRDGIRLSAVAITLVVKISTWWKSGRRYSWSCVNELESNSRLIFVAYIHSLHLSKNISCIHCIISGSYQNFHYIVSLIYKVELHAWNILILKTVFIYANFREGISVLIKFFIISSHTWRNWVRSNYAKDFSTGKLCKQ